MQKQSFEIQFGDKTLRAEFNDLAKRANSSVMLYYGDTVILVTATMGGKKDLDYFPLSVEYEEKFYASGAILGSRFQRREGRPSDEAILSARIVDRTIRPLFDHSLRREVQVVVTILSLGEDDPDVLAVIGASLALGTSSIPWGGPVSAVRLGKTKGKDELIINPSYSERDSENEELDLLVCGKDSLINMIEVGAKEVSENTLEQGLEFAVDIHNKLNTWQQEIIDKIGKEKEEIEKEEYPQELLDLYTKELEPKMFEWVFEKNETYALKDLWLQTVQENLGDEFLPFADHLFEEKIDEFVHKEATENSRRQDGRKMDEIRELYAQAGGISNIIHGTGIFYRGDTHVFSALTLGSPSDAQVVDTIETPDAQKRFMHHYNFPPFSVGETGRVGGFNRRAIGHGALAEKALRPVIPSKDEFPYTVRIVSETMSSNGSSSQASICASSLALHDAGVPVKSHVAGIAMGLMASEELLGQSKWESDKYKILTDIQGPEDHFGDMDFKVAGTRQGVTAVQMDVKLLGVPAHVLKEAFEQAKKARYEILDLLEGEIKEPRSELPENAPRIETIKIDADKIGLVIGSGGKTIQGIKEDSGVEDITIEEDGTVYISGKGDSTEKARKAIEELTRVFEEGDKVTGEVVRIEPYGAFVKLNSQNDGLVHISEMSKDRIENVSDVLSLGDKVPVVVKGVDEKGRIKLSIKDADPDFIKVKKG